MLAQPPPPVLFSKIKSRPWSCQSYFFGGLDTIFLETLTHVLSLQNKKCADIYKRLRCYNILVPIEKAHCRTCKKILWCTVAQGQDLSKKFAFFRLMYVPLLHCNVCNVSKQVESPTFCKGQKRHFSFSFLIDLYLENKINLEKSSLTNWIFSLFRTGFLLP